MFTAKDLKKIVGNALRWEIYDDEDLVVYDETAYSKGTERYLEFQSEVRVLDERGVEVFKTDNVDELEAYVKKWMKKKPVGKVTLWK